MKFQKMTAKEFIETLNIIGQEYSDTIPKREIFSLAKEFKLMPVREVVKLLNAQNYDHRLGAVSILDWKARNKGTSAEERREFYQAYMDHHKNIDDWGMVDRAAPYVVGGYLFDKDRAPLYELARSANPMERRTAIVSTYFFIRQDQTDDTFKIAEMLVHDPEHFVQTAVGSWIREAGKKDEVRLRGFLDQFAQGMPRVALRYAIEKLDPELRKHYLNL